MEPSRFLECLDRGYARLSDVVGGALTEKVPSCPDWTGTDLVRHVAEVYLHKAETMRYGKWPDPWPPDFSAEQVMPLLDEAYLALAGELAEHDPAGHCLTWYDDDQTYGFWLRRMAQETVIHRIDAELTAGVESQPVPDDLALDGIDELLERFLAFGTRQWPDYFAEELAGLTGDVEVRAGNNGRWLVHIGNTEVTVERGAGNGTETVVAGSADQVLRCLWHRGTTDVRAAGDEALVEKLHKLLVLAT